MPPMVCDKATIREEKSASMLHRASAEAIVISMDKESGEAIALRRINAPHNNPNTTPINMTAALPEFE